MYSATNLGNVITAIQAAMRKRHAMHCACLTFIACMVLPYTTARAQLVLDQTHTLDSLVQHVLLGTGVQASNVIFNDVAGNTATPQPGRGEVGWFSGANTCLGLDQGVFLVNGPAHTLPGPNNSLDATPVHAGAGNPVITPDLDLSQLTGWSHWQEYGGTNIHGKSVLEFDFVPEKDMVSLRYVFSSEEYEYKVCSEYPDVFGLFLSGPGISGSFTNNAMNIALLPGRPVRVGINSVNNGHLDAANANGPFFDPFTYCDNANPSWSSVDTAYYRYNGGQWPTTPPAYYAQQLAAPYNTAPYYIQHNGLTVVLTASAAVQCGELYHAKLAIGNPNFYLTSALWMEEGSFASSNRFGVSVGAGPSVDLSGSTPVLVESSTDSVYLHFRRLGGSYADEYVQLSVAGDAVPGQDYLPALPDSIHFHPWDSVATVAIALPEIHGGVRNLTIYMLTCGGANTVSLPLTIIDALHVGLECGAPVQAKPFLFPNPAKDAATVAWPAASGTSCQFMLYNAMGAEVLRTQLPAGPGRKSINVAGLPPGIYQYRITSRSAVEGEGKLVIAP